MKKDILERLDGIRFCFLSCEGKMEKITKEKAISMLKDRADAKLHIGEVVTEISTKDFSILC